ncbi:PLAC8 family protein [Venustampulla echinocandica]|uniref:PLAC8 family protein n=1 Tax=Venustampulla echinocandica TaxID=2656787 RepID=A0A370TB71_9HELO|nr:PLAC8 family protein [Venustampulla echinocandica]RDL31174.1 PLAC8 family protein [Venustampulla echinocandica]
MSDIKQQPVTQQPTASNNLTYKQVTTVTGTEPWTSDIFNCLDGGLDGNDNLCLKGTFCPCFVYGKTAARMRDPSLTGYDRINNDCLFWAGASYCGLQWVLTFLKRGEIRENYHIQGDALTDCLFSAFCGCCSVIQHEKEVLAKLSQQGVVSQGYQAPAAMAAP